MNILSIDTSTPHLSIAVTSEDRRAELSLHLGLTHSEKLIPAIDRICKDCSISIRDLDLVVCSRGPGSFTGLRIGLATAKGISLGAGCPLITIPSLDAYSYPFRNLPGIVVPVIDAKKKHVFSALYKNGERMGDYLDISPSALAEVLLNETRPVFLVGPDFSLLAPFLPAKSRIVLLETIFSGKSLAFRDIAVQLYSKGYKEPDESGLLYLRDSEAELKKND